MLDMFTKDTPTLFVDVLNVILGTLSLSRTVTAMCCEPLIPMLLLRIAYCVFLYDIDRRILPRARSKLRSTNSVGNLESRVVGVILERCRKILIKQREEK